MRMYKDTHIHFVGTHIYNAPCFPLHREDFHFSVENLEVYSIHTNQLLLQALSMTDFQLYFF